MVRTAMLEGAIRMLADRDGETAAGVRMEYERARTLAMDRTRRQAVSEHDRLRAEAITRATRRAGNDPW